MQTPFKRYMMGERYILAVDQGTSGTKTVVFDSKGELRAKASAELKSLYPAVGYVEQDPEDIFQNVLESTRKCVDEFKKNVSDDLSQIKACGISNQRETFVIWDEKGEPIHNAVVWQCKRSVDLCERIRSDSLEKEVKNRTGLIIDPYFSGTKAMWLNENVDKVKQAVARGQAFFGTVDAWLLYKLTGGKSYCCDYTNASRTLFFNINELKWDDVLLDKFGLTRLNLPVPKPSSFSYGGSDFEGIFPGKVKISGMIGDSHAAAFGEGCFSSGTAKVTMGTGSSILMNTGNQKIESKNGMVSTICWSIQDRTDYALEGIIVTCGATIKWLCDQLGMFDQAKDTEALALRVDDNHGVYLIPAFSGLGAPHWKMGAKAAITGLTFGAKKEHVIRAALESIPYQIKDIIVAMEKDSGIPLKELKADGGITANGFVMQFLTDLLGCRVANIGIEEVSALGAAYMAGLEAGVYRDVAHLEELSKSKKTFAPGKDTQRVEQGYAGWQRTVAEIK